MKLSLRLTLFILRSTLYNQQTTRSESLTTTPTISVNFDIDYFHAGGLSFFTGDTFTPYLAGSAFIAYFNPNAVTSGGKACYL